MLQEEGSVHFVFFTGDAAQSGKPEASRAGLGAVRQASRKVRLRPLALAYAALPSPDLRRLVFGRAANLMVAAIPALVSLASHGELTNTNLARMDSWRISLTSRSSERP